MSTAISRTIRLRTASLLRIVIFLSIIVHTEAAFAQVYRINLDRLTCLDDEMDSYQIFKAHPSRPVKLPAGDGQNRHFLTEFYSWKMTNDPDIVIMVESKAGWDLLYIDKNLNHDLTDDGLPLLFPFSRDTISFDIVAPNDKRQRTKIMFSRNKNYKRMFMALPDSIRNKEQDQFGNLDPKFAQIVGQMKGVPDFKGAAGSFYFADRMSVRRGSVTLEGKTYSLGLFDYSNNGRYDDDDDVVFAAPGENALLQYASGSNGTYALNDVFQLGEGHYKVRGVDRYGTWMDIERTADQTTAFFTEKFDSLMTSGARTVTLPPEFWDHAFLSLNGDSVSLRSMKGRYLLLNFWMQGCKPCMEEIPRLVEARKAYPDSLIRFVSFIKYASKEKVEKVVKESGMSWPQIAVTDEIETKFHVRGYPSNLLFFPVGLKCVSAGAVNDFFFKKYVK